MDNCDFTLTIITIIGMLASAFVGAAIGYIFTRINTKEIIKIQEFNKAAANFRTAFTDEIRLLQTERPSFNFLEGTAYHIIKNAFTKHENARILFEPFLDSNTRVRFNALWEEYRSKETKEVHPNNDFDCYISDTESIIGDDKKRTLALDRINKLLEFTT